jgi:hypothetical protein
MDNDALNVAQEFYAPVSSDDANIAHTIPFQGILDRDEATTLNI